MTEPNPSATVANLPINHGAVLLTVRRELCPHCGAHVYIDPQDWQFTLSRQRAYHCWACGDDMHNLAVDVSKLNDTEQLIWKILSGGEPLQIKEILYRLEKDHMTIIDQRSVERYLSKSSKLRKLGIYNKQGQGYFIGK